MFVHPVSRNTPALKLEINTMRARLLAACIMAPLALAGCKSPTFSDDVTGSISKEAGSLAPGDENLRRYTDQLGKNYKSNPNDKATALAYARALRLRGLSSEAVAVTQGLAVNHPQDREILASYGKALADAGRLDQAADVLRRATSATQPDWRLLSTQGSVADRKGEFVTARAYYREALKIAPGEPSILSNLGLSFALTKELPQAEGALREAVASPRADSRMRQNLALVLALEGKYAEAEQVSERDLSPEQTAANIAAVQRLSSQTNSWNTLSELDRAHARQAAPGKPRRRVARPAHSEKPKAAANDARNDQAADAALAQ